MKNRNQPGFANRLINFRHQENPLRNALIVTFVCLFLIPLGCASKSDKVTEAPQPAISSAAVGTGTPIVEVPDTIFDFGDVTDGNDYVHAFVIKNAGAGVLEIKKVLPG
jgi:hypothetical protein